MPWFFIARVDLGISLSPLERCFLVLVFIYILQRFRTKTFSHNERPGMEQFPLKFADMSIDQFWCFGLRFAQLFFFGRFFLISQQVFQVGFPLLRRFSLQFFVDCPVLPIYFKEFHRIGAFTIIPGLCTAINAVSFFDPVPDEAALIRRHWLPGDIILVFIPKVVLSAVI